MTRHWEPGVTYSAGEVLEYQGQRYRVIQGHSSQSDWAPGIATAALFGHLGSSGHHKPCHEHPQVPVQNTNPLESLQNPLTLKIGSFSRERWLQDSRQRTDEFNRTGPCAPTTWVLVSGREIPGNAIEAGKEHDNALYIARAYVEDGLYVGKAGRHLAQGAEIGRQHKSYALQVYEVLIGDPRAVHWVGTHGLPNPQNLGARHVDAGVDLHGHQIFIAQVSHNGGIHPARASGGASGAYLAYGDKELAFQEYRVLCYA
ncbi:hypothetical protein BDM02DRAFT_3113500 [Thelephora ganbajun]|uniref:Uncharacterized protein n=1 Tax=Thelephora ganbajun TaxID=370292 RepID=A0ACB6ZJ96_THEGA|nr:hypothetical protein BDM02DRAFT_3113500 [Thelephora ganbajun]